MVTCYPCSFVASVRNVLFPTDFTDFHRFGYMLSVFICVISGKCSFLPRIFTDLHGFSRNFSHWIFSCRLGEIALRILLTERLKQKYCLSAASLFLFSGDDKILADLSAAASFFCFSFLRKKRERK